MDGSGPCLPLLLEFLSSGESFKSFSHFLPLVEKCQEESRAMKVLLDNFTSSNCFERYKVEIIDSKISFAPYICGLKKESICVIYAIQ